MKHYSFPYIYHLKDVLPHIEGRDEFIVVEKDDYTVVNYVVQTNDTFAWDPDDPDGSAIRRECRGLLFHKDGIIASRRYHKFFNLNENEDVMETDQTFKIGHEILDKLDGSMISPIKIGNWIRWTTKMGITDVAMTCERFIARSDIRYTEMARYLITNGFTPIFEWCSKKNQIVLDYPDQLVLTAIRHTTNGIYLPRYKCEEIANEYNIPCVEVLDIEDSSSIKELAENSTDTEGWVVRYDTGHMVKIKTPWYVQLHKIVSNIESPRQLVGIVLDKTVDDISAQLNSIDKQRFDDFAWRTEQIAGNIESDIEGLGYARATYWALTGGNRKRFATQHAGKMDKFVRSILFASWDDGDVRTAYYNSVRKNINKDKRFNEYTLLQDIR